MNLEQLKYERRVPDELERAMLKIFLEQRLGWRWEFDSVQAYLGMLPKPLLMQLVYEVNHNNGTPSQFDYLFFYLPQNIYKVWQPLLELYRTNKLTTQLSVLEVSNIPGAVSLGIVEFYKRYALCYQDLDFKLEFTMAATESDHINLATKLLIEQETGLPANLEIKIETCAQTNTNLSNWDQFNLIVLSEQQWPLDQVKQLRQQAMEPSSSLVLIEASACPNVSSFAHKPAIFDVLYTYGLQKQVFNYPPSRYKIL